MIGTGAKPLTGIRAAFVFARTEPAISRQPHQGQAPHDHIADKVQLGSNARGHV